MHALTTATQPQEYKQCIASTGHLTSSIRCALSLAQQRRWGPSVSLASAAADKQPAPNTALNSRNAEQIDQLLVSLSELRIKQQQGLMTEVDAEEEWDEFEDGEEGVDWVWWRVADPQTSAGNEALAGSSPATQASIAQGQQQHQQQHYPQQEQQQQQQQQPSQEQQQDPRHSRNKRAVLGKGYQPGRTAKELPVASGDTSGSNSITAACITSSSGSSSRRRRRNRTADHE